MAIRRVLAWTALLLASSGVLVAQQGIGPPASSHGGGKVASAELGGGLGAGTVAEVYELSYDNEFSGLPDTLDFDDRFGAAVVPLGDLDGDGIDELAVGAIRDEDGGDQRGAVWILFLDTQGKVRRGQKISVTHGGFTGALDDSDNFGNALAALGDLDGDGIPELAVGALGDDDPGPASSSSTGALWILFLDAGGRVKAHQKISQSEGGPVPAYDVGNGFGKALAALPDLDGDGVPELAVSATVLGRGTVFLYLLRADGTLKSFLRIAENQGGFTGDLRRTTAFGQSLAVLGDLDGNGIAELAVGASKDSQTGALWILFLGPGGAVQSQLEIASSQAGLPALAQGDLFGFAAAAPGDLDGDTVPDVVVGAPGDDFAGLSAGALWVLYLNADGSVKANHRLSNLEGGLNSRIQSLGLGSSLAALGDVDGDGLPELVAGTPEKAAGGGIWTLFLDATERARRVQGIHATAGNFTGALQDNETLGTSLATLGDFDGDGIEDLATGAQLANASGRVWILLLRPDGGVREFRRITPDVNGFVGPEPGDSFGASVASLGDLDGDGTTDLAVGSPKRGLQSGAVWILFLDPQARVRSTRVIESGTPGLGIIPQLSLFGGAVASLGDLDGDGVTDLAVGGKDFAPSGSVWILFLDTDGSVKRSQAINALGGFGGTLHFRDGFGGGLATLGDLDGDGIVELAVGAIDEAVRRGAVWILFLRADGTVRTQQKINTSEGGFFGQLPSNANFGMALAGLADVDGDRVQDLFVGAPGAGEDDEGAGWVLFLRPNGTVRGQRMLADRINGFPELGFDDGYGRSACGFGDRNGDGTPDLVVGTPFRPAGGLHHGAAWHLALDGIARAGFEHGDDAFARPLGNGQSLIGSGFGRVLELASTGANLGPAIFDSRPAGPNAVSQDRDLLVGKGNVLIFQNSQAPTQSVAGIFDRPNDDQDGGTLTIRFQGPVEVKSLDLVDIDLGSGQAAEVKLFDIAGRTRTTFVPAGFTEDLVAQGPPAWRSLDLTTLGPQSGFAATATSSQTNGFDPRAVVRLEVRLGSSGAIDELAWDPYPD